MYVGYIRERYGLSPVCTSEKAINLFKVKVDVRKGGGLRFREKFDNGCVSFIHFMFSFIVVVHS